MPKLTIDVTADDVRFGVRNACRFCPVARAVARTLGLDLGRGVTVTPGYVFLDGTGWPGAVAPLPPAATEAIERYDKSGEMAPFSFEIEIDDPRGA